MGRVLFITSFYSGLKHSVKQNVWEPKGMPAMYKLLEAVKASDLDFDYCFLDQKENTLIDIKNSNFPTTSFYVLNISQKEIPFPFKFLQPYTQTRKKKQEIQRCIDFSKYDLIYTDRANVDLIPFFLKKFKGKIFLRLHGVGTLYQSYKNSLKFRLYNYVKLLGFGKKIDFVLSSMDGTPVTKFMKEYIHENTQKERILNGVSIHPKVERSKDDIIKFLFVGRLEKDKGILQIIDVFNSLPEEVSSKLSLTVVGSGRLLEKVIETSIDNPSIIVMSGVEHKRMQEIYLKSDVLISLNLLGNLSNVVLEAINYELAIITLKSDEIREFDEESNEFLSDHVVYVERDKIRSQLLEKLSSLVENIDEVEDLQNRTRDFLKPKLISWEKRMETEIKIISDLIKH